MVIPVMLLLAACGERTPESGDGKGSTTPPYIRSEPAPLPAGRVEPVRIGELGPNFPACGGRGGTRGQVAGPVPVLAAPYHSEDAIDQIQPGAEFFICTRTHDQRWLGIVYDEGGRASPRCGVSAPIPNRRNYQGRCAAGWVSAAAVRLVSGVPHQLASPPPVD